MSPLPTFVCEINYTKLIIVVVPQAGETSNKKQVCFRSLFALGLCQISGNYPVSAAFSNILYPAGYQYLVRIFLVCILDFLS